jgi:hypothetical protein
VGAITRPLRPGDINRETLRDGGGEARLRLA